MLLVWIGGSVATADTVGLDLYRVRLREARDLVTSARALPLGSRPALVARAQDVLRSTDAIRLADGSTLSIDESALVARLSTDYDVLTNAIADIDARLAFADRAAVSRVTGAVVDDRLRAAIRVRAAPAAADQGPLGWLVDLLARARQAIASVVRDALGIVDPAFVVQAVTGVGIAIALLVLGVLGRGVRERIRREALSGDARIGTAEDPAEHLRRADAAIAAGHGREALHELYLFAIKTLAAREVIRFDPALTDRELLGRAAAIPQIDSLRALVTLHERIWFGLRAADPSDAARARDLAQRVAA